MLLFLLCYSCIEDYDIESSYYNPVIVIEGLITNEPPPYSVLVHKSIPYDGELQIEPVSDAEVFIITDENETKLYLSKEGTYQTEEITGNVNTYYTLSVVYENKIYEAGSVMPEASTIDSIQTTIISGVETEDALYNTTLFLGEKTEKESYYYIELHVNDSNISSFTGLQIYPVFTDYYMNNIRSYTLPYDFRKGDNVNIKIYSLTEEMFVYLNTLNIQVLHYYDYIHLFPENLPSVFSNGALGYFQVSAVVERNITII